MKHPVLVEIIACLFIFLFIYAAVSKLTAFQEFQIQLSRSPLLKDYAGWVAWMIPVLEIGISVLLAIPRRRLAGLYAAFGLMVMFTGYIIAITQFSDFIPCSCGGVLQHMSWNQHLVFNLGFLVLGAAGILFEEGRMRRRGRTAGWPAAEVC